MTEEQKRKRAESQKKYRATHRKEYQEYQREYVKRNQEKIKEMSKRWRDNNREKINEYHRQEYVLEYERKRKKKANQESFEECDKDLYRQRWTKAETDYLVENYQNKTIPELAKEMGRTIIAIERKRNKLGLRKEQK